MRLKKFHTLNQGCSTSTLYAIIPPTPRKKHTVLVSAIKTSAVQPVVCDPKTKQIKPNHKHITSRVDNDIPGCGYWTRSVGKPR